MWRIGYLLVVVAPWYCGLELSASDENSHFVTPPFYQLQVGQACGHLLGSAHAGVSLRQLPGDFERRLYNAGVLIVEFNLSEHPSFPDSVQSALQTTTDYQLSDLIGDRRVDLIMEKFSLPPLAREVVEKTHPAQILMAMPYAEWKAPTLDSEIVAQAKGASIAIFEMDTIEEHLQLLLSQIPTDINEASAQLIQVLDDWDKFKKSQERMLAWYLKGNPKEMMDYLDSKMDEKQRTGLRRTNQRWAPIIATAVKEGKNPMIVVGVCHLEGVSGLIPLLKELGVEVTPYEFEEPKPYAP